MKEEIKCVNCDERGSVKMANRIIEVKTLILDEESNHIWEEFTALLCDLHSKYPNDEDIEKLYLELEDFNFTVVMKIESEDGSITEP